MMGGIRESEDHERRTRANDDGRHHFLTTSEMEAGTTMFGKHRRSSGGGIGRLSLLTAALFVAGCGSASGGTSSAPAANGGGLKAVVVENQESGDKGPVDSTLAGLTRGASALGYQVSDVYVADPSQFEPTLRKFASEGYNLIITTFPPLTQPSINVAKQFPNTYFMSSNGQPTPDSQIPPNMQIVFGKDQQGTFLAGALAAMMTKTNKVAMISGPIIDVQLRWLSGFYQGALSVNPKICVSDAATSSYQDPVGGKELGLRFFQSGIDVIGVSAAGSDLGVHQAAESNPNRWHTITEDALSITDVAPNAGLAAIVNRYDNWVYLAMQEVKDHTWKHGTVYLSLGDGSWSLLQWGHSVPQDIQDKVTAMSKQIVSGSLTVQDDAKATELAQLRATGSANCTS
jgi:basic membrane protein A and related proteins